MQRIYFLVPNKALTEKIVAEVEAAGVVEKHIHIIAAEGVELDSLPEATLLQKSDFVAALERGLPVGAATGLLAGLVTRWCCAERRRNPRMYGGGCRYRFLDGQHGGAGYSKLPTQRLPKSCGQRRVPHVARCAKRPCRTH